MKFLAAGSTHIQIMVLIMLKCALSDFVQVKTHFGFLRFLIVLGIPSSHFTPDGPDHLLLLGAVFNVEVN